MGHFLMFCLVPKLEWAVRSKYHNLLILEAKRQKPGLSESFVGLEIHMILEYLSFAGFEVLIILDSTYVYK